MSGSFPEAVSAVILDLYASFSSVTILIVTSGFCFSNSLARCAQTPLAGSVVVMFHHSMVVLPEEFPPLSEPPHALRAPAAPAARPHGRGGGQESAAGQGLDRGVSPIAGIAHLPEGHR